jgi:hypothetical protein
MSSRKSARAPPTVAAWNTSAISAVRMLRAAMRASTMAQRISSSMFCGTVSVPMPRLTPARRYRPKSSSV